MNARNTRSSYGWVARFFHWTIAALILAAIGFGLYAESLPTTSDSDIARLFGVFSIHKTIGISVLVLALLRILWALSQPRPAPLHPERRAETLLAETIHWALYGGMIVMPLSGWLRHASAPGEFARILWPFGQRLPGLPVDAAVSAAFSAIHQTSWVVLAVLIALHVIGALKHAVIDRDATLARMAGNGANLPEPAAGPHRPAFVAPLLALAIWAGAISLAVSTGPEEPVAAPSAIAGQPVTDTAPSQTTAAIWQVQQGTLTISVNQGSSPVTGQFAEWDARISYDEASRTGHVEVSIPLASLTLGSITATALGPDFMKAADHPVATLTAEISPRDDGLLAAGTMSLAGAEAPISLPFTLSIDGDTATMTGQTVLDRRDFGIGTGYADESTVGFGVTVDVALTATRQ